MIDSVLGVELPLPVKLIVAFVIVLALIALATWVFRRLGGDRAGPTPARGRQPRLAVIDAASVDGRRRLVLLRRDNVEHLVMIGGPADIVIEQNIVRAVPVAPQAQRQAGEPALRPPPEPLMQRPPADSYRVAPEAPPAPRQPRLEPMPRQPRPELARPELARPELTRPAPQAPAPRAMRPPAQSRRHEPEAPVEVHSAPPTADAGLADMATKLEAALRRPPQPRVEPEPGPVLQGPTPPTVPAAEPAGPPKPTPAAKPEPSPPAAAAGEKAAADSNGSAKPPAPPKSVFDSLEEEMASLLGRPPEKK